jgi:AIPR protein
MPNLQTFSLIQQRVNRYKRDYSLEKDGVAFAWVALEIILNLNEDEIEEALTDGNGDGGIDAIHIADRDIHIFTFKYTNSFESTFKNFPETDLDTFLVTMERIMSHSLSKEAVNDLVWDKAQEIWGLFGTGPLNFNFYVCSNKEKPTEQAQKRFQDNLDRYKFVEYFYFDQESLATKILENKYRKVDGKIRFIEKQYFDRSDGGSLRGIVATVAATDLIKLVEDPERPGKINEDAFNDNARIYFKLQNMINRGIFDTALSEENYEFWYLNNGITIVCDECEYMPNTRSPLAILKNFQIVNGGQTTHALFEAYLEDRQKIDDVLVLVRVCQTTNHKISEKIGETTNSQTPVLTRDLHANDRIQKQLEDEFNSLGFFYERKRNQYATQPKTKRLDNELLGQMFLAYYLDMPSEARNSKSLVFGGKYSDIFNEHTTASMLLLPYRIYSPLDARRKEIQRKKRNRDQISERDAFVSRATFHILNGVKLVAEKEDIDLGSQDGINRAIELTIKYIEEVVDKEAKMRGEPYTHDKFFKEIPTNRKIRDHIIAKYP